MRVDWRLLGQRKWIGQLLFCVLAFIFGFGFGRQRREGDHTTTCELRDGASAEFGTGPLLKIEPPSQAFALRCKHVVSPSSFKPKTKIAIGHRNPAIRPLLFNGHWATGWGLIEHAGRIFYREAIVGNPNPSLPSRRNVRSSSTSDYFHTHIDGIPLPGPAIDEIQPLFVLTEADGEQKRHGKAERNKEGRQSHGLLHLVSLKPTPNAAFAQALSRAA